jgi:cobalt-zinc-cadmium efflux system protein
MTSADQHAGHGHGPGGHTHRPGKDAHGAGGHAHGACGDARWLSAALALIVAFMAGEIIAGLAAHSLALISDAAHMLTDAAAIALVLITARLAARPPAGGYTYGLKRAEILSAQANGITLVLLAAWLGYSAIRHLISPPSVTGGVVLAVALAGVVVNIAATLLMARARGDRASLNVEGAFKHLLTDLYAFIATAAAGLIIVLTGFARADAIATLIVVLLMLHAGYGLVRDSGRIFLEAAPAGVSPEAVGAAMAGRRYVAEVHDLHIWEITSGMPAASAHVLVAPGSDCHAVRADLETFLAASYGITHATLQVDHAPAAQDNGTAHGSSAGDQHHCEDAHGPSYRPGLGQPTGLPAFQQEAPAAGIRSGAGGVQVGRPGLVPAQASSEGAAVAYGCRNE